MSFNPAVFGLPSAPNASSFNFPLTTNDIPYSTIATARGERGAGLAGRRIPYTNFGIRAGIRRIRSSPSNSLSSFPQQPPVPLHQNLPNTSPLLQLKQTLKQTLFYLSITTLASFLTDILLYIKNSLHLPNRFCICICLHPALPIPPTAAHPAQRAPEFNSAFTTRLPSTNYSPAPSLLALPTKQHRMSAHIHLANQPNVFVWDTQPLENPTHLNYKRINIRRDHQDTIDMKVDYNMRLNSYKFQLNVTYSFSLNKPDDWFYLMTNPYTGKRNPGHPKTRTAIMNIATAAAWYPILNNLGFEWCERYAVCLQTCRRVYVNFHGINKFFRGYELLPQPGQPAQPNQN